MKNIQTETDTQADNLKIYIKMIHPEEPIPSVEEMREMISTAYHFPNLNARWNPVKRFLKILFFVPVFEILWSSDSETFINFARSKISLKKALKMNTYRHACNFCGKRFITPSNLNSHTLMHTGECPYTCQFRYRPNRSTEIKRQKYYQFCVLIS